MARTGTVITAGELGLVGCQHCTRPSPLGTKTCPRCDYPLERRDHSSLQRVWAYWLMGVAFYIPANLEPMLQTDTLTEHHDSTIIGGAVELAHHGNWGVAIIILFASVAIPVAKFLALAGLALGVWRGSSLSDHHRHLAYEVVEYIGRWSMIDVFVVAILSALVQFDSLATISPGRASLYFALSVIFTMLSARAFDSRMIWDRPYGPEARGVTGAGPGGAPLTMEEGVRT